MPAMQLQCIGAVVREYQSEDAESISLIDDASRTGAMSVVKLRDYANDMLVLERSGKIRGYCLYSERRNSFRILHMSVDQQRSGFGCRLINALLTRAITKGKSRIDAYVDEKNVQGQLWFARRGFECVEIVTVGNLVQYVFRSLRSQL